MATVTDRKRADGSIAWRALVRFKRHGKVIFREARTFDRKVLAENWAKRLEIELQKPGAIDARRLNKIKLGELINKYINEVGALQSFGRTKSFTLDKLANSELAECQIKTLESKHIVDHCIIRKNEGAGPATVSQDIAYLRAVLSVATPIWGLPIDSTVIDQSVPTLKKLGLVGKSNKRNRRPAADEIEQLKVAFSKRDKRGDIPMFDIFQFAIYSAMRQSEICQIKWEDLNDSKKTVIIRDRKDPSNKDGNDQEVPLLGEAWEIVNRQPRLSDCIFPYNSRSVGAAFTRTVRELKIIDLRFHDLRHEGASRLFELGYSIEQVAMVTGHKDWNMLRRYTQLKPESLHR